MCEIFRATFEAGVQLGMKARRRASEDRVERYQASVKATKEANLERRLERVLRVLADSNKVPLSIAQIRVKVAGKNELLIDALRKLEDAGAVEQLFKGSRSRGWVITDRGLAGLLAIVADDSREPSA